MRKPTTTKTAQKECRRPGHQTSLFSFWKKPTSSIQDQATEDDETLDNVTDIELTTATSPSTSTERWEVESASVPATVSPVQDGVSLSQNSDSGVDSMKGSQEDKDSVETGSPETGHETSKQPEGLSDYELLRWRNIQRNNQRLAALGLLSTKNQEDSTMLSATTSTARPSNRRKRPAKALKSDASSIVPTRRSTRIRRSSQSPDADAINEPTKEPDSAPGSGAASDSPNQEIEEPETYIVSPLLDYSMTGSDNGLHQSRGSHVSACSPMPHVDSAAQEVSLAPMNIRLAPPKGLGAIYSLQFSKPSRQLSTTSGASSQWLVGAGKSGIIALWNCDSASTCDSTSRQNPFYKDPVLSWKAHAGRWVADARFLTIPNQGNNSNRLDGTQALLTAANDGCVCLWDLAKVSASTGAPKLIHRTGKELHSSGIFAMDSIHDSTHARMATASKDKTVAISSLGEQASSPFTCFWRSEHHKAKVGAVQLRGLDSTLLASASDDGLVAIHDFRANRVVSELPREAHGRPHSVVWDTVCEHPRLLTAGHDPIMKLWDLRTTREPLAQLEGHVPTSTTRCKRIHRPSFYNSFSGTSSKRDTSYGSGYILTGGQGSNSLSMFSQSRQEQRRLSSSQCAGNDQSGSARDAIESSWTLNSRGVLPQDCAGDVGCIAVEQIVGGRIAVSVEHGEILFLRPQSGQRDICVI